MPETDDQPLLTRPRKPAMISPYLQASYTNRSNADPKSCSATQKVEPVVIEISDDEDMHQAAGGGQGKPTQLNRHDPGPRDAKWHSEKPSPANSQHSLTHTDIAEKSPGALSWAGPGNASRPFSRITTPLHHVHRYAYDQLGPSSLLSNTPRSSDDLPRHSPKLGSVYFQSREGSIASNNAPPQSRSAPHPQGPFWRPSDGHVGANLMLKRLGHDNSIRQRRICSNCSDAAMGCDGQSPCNGCVEPGLQCKYDRLLHEPVASTNSVLTARFRMTAQGNEGHSALSLSLTPPHISLNHHSDASQSLMRMTRDTANTINPLDRLFSRVHSKQPTSITHSSAPPQSVTHPRLLRNFSPEPATFPTFDPQDVEKVVRKFEAQMREHQEYLLQSQLHQARMDCKKMGVHTVREDISDPFAALRGPALPVSEHSTDSPKNKNAHKLILQSKAFADIGHPHPKWERSNIMVCDFQCTTEALPKYKSLSRVGTSLLSRNYRTLKYMPYYVENEYASQDDINKYEELDQRYQQDIPKLMSQRKCHELAGMWRPWIGMLLGNLGLSGDIVRSYFLHSDALEGELSDDELARWTQDTMDTCRTCETEDDSVIRSLGSPASKSAFKASHLRLLHALHFQFQNVADSHIWHVLRTFPEKSKCEETSIPVVHGAVGPQNNALCLICYRHHCPTHGAFRDGGEDDFGQDLVLINNLEAEHNEHAAVTLSTTSQPQTHFCGICCAPTDTLISALLGRQPDGRITGTVRCIIDSSETFHDSEECGKRCFWPIHNRTRAAEAIKDVQSHPPRELPAKVMAAMTYLLPLFSRHKRGPCLISRALKDVLCLDVFYHMVATINSTAHNEAEIQAFEVTRMKAKGRPDLSRVEFSLTHKLDARQPFVPCSHTGPCQNNADCSCFANQVVCEWLCGCDVACRRRYQGCSCAGAAKSCFQDARCECWQLNRECDPNLCANCGVTEVLDPLHKYNESVRHDRCKNNRLQLNIPKRTLKAPSEVQGWGLYAGEDIEAFDYIGEYKGEIIENQEGDRRGATYHNLGLEYLFTLNKEQQIDASNVGNKMRLMNNSQLKANINVVAQKMLCNGVQRIMLYAKRRIRAGEELLYNYNYPPAVTKNFWERGEKPPFKQGTLGIRATTSRPLNIGSGRFAKTSNLQARGTRSNKMDIDFENRDLSQSPIMSRKKRKRVVGSPQSTEELEQVPTLSPKIQVEIDAPDESEYSYDEHEISAEESADEDEVERDEDIPHSEASPSGTAQQRKISNADRRVGGLAQRRAWRTRKKNMQVPRAGGKR